MLQSLSIKPTHPVLHEKRDESPRTVSPGVHVTATVDAHKPLAATLHVFADAADSTEATSPIAARLMHGASFSDHEESATIDRAPAFTVRTDLGALRKLRSKLDKCVGGHARHCSQCHVVKHYLSVCWDRPRLLHRTWDGAAALQSDPLAGFVNQLLGFACQLAAGGSVANEGDDAHQEFVQILVAFLRPSP